LRRILQLNARCGQFVADPVRQCKVARLLGGGAISDAGLDAGLVQC